MTVSLTSNTTRLPNVPPYNTFSLTCTATVPEGVVSPKIFTWWRQNSTVNNSLEEFGITSINLNQTISTSMLVVTETTAGIWHFSCEVAIPELFNVSNRSDAYHSINVTGKSYFCIAYAPLFDGTESNFSECVCKCVCCALFYVQERGSQKSLYTLQQPLSRPTQPLSTGL